MKPQIRGIACDWGNVNGCFDHTLAAAGFAEVSPLLAEEIYGLIFETPLEQSYDCGMPTAEFLADLRTLLRIAGDVSNERIAAIWQGIFSRTEDNERVIGTLRRIPRSVRLVLASNTNELHFDYIERAWADLIGYLDGVVVSFRVKHRKPAREFYAAVLAALATPPAETLFIDDRAEMVQGAVDHFGMQGLQYVAGTTDLAASLAEFGVELDGDRG